MSDMFTNAKSPFYESTSFLYLDKIEPKVYAEFIRDKFAKESEVRQPTAAAFLQKYKIGNAANPTVCTMSL